MKTKTSRTAPKSSSTIDLRGRPNGSTNERRGIVRTYDVEVMHPALSVENGKVGFPNLPEGWIAKTVRVSGFDRTDAAACAVEAVRKSVLKAVNTARGIDRSGLRFKTGTPKFD
jgi:hypothetical protein